MRGGRNNQIGRRSRRTHRDGLRPCGKRVRQKRRQKNIRGQGQALRQPADSPHRRLRADIRNRLRDPNARRKTRRSLLAGASDDDNAEIKEDSLYHQRRPRYRRHKNAVAFCRAGAYPSLRSAACGAVGKSFRQPQPHERKTRFRGHERPHSRNYRRRRIGRRGGIHGNIL